MDSTSDNTLGSLGIDAQCKQKKINPPKIQSNCFAKAGDEEIISAMQLNYAEKQIDLIKLNKEEKSLKLNNAQQIVEGLAASLGAQGLLQNMLVTQLLGIHELQQKLLPLANRSTNHPEHNQYYINSITKLSNVFIQQINTLQKLQGSNHQKVTVEHLHVHDGGQAMVGQVNTHLGVSNEN